MRYLLHITKKNELRARMEYLYKVFHMWFYLDGVVEDFIQLRSMPDIEKGICFITGHNFQVAELLDQKTLEADVLVLNTCFPKQFSKYTSSFRKMYICRPTDNNGQAKVHCGEDYGCHFEVLDSELDLAKSKKESTIDRIKESYLRL